jgi:hypothetical protein
VLRCLSGFASRYFGQQTGSTPSVAQTEHRCKTSILLGVRSRYTRAGPLQCPFRQHDLRRGHATQEPDGSAFPRVRGRRPVAPRGSRWFAPGVVRGARLTARHSGAETFASAPAEPSLRHGQSIAIRRFSPRRSRGPRFGSTTLLRSRGEVAARRARTEVPVAPAERVHK